MFASTTVGRREEAQTKSHARTRKNRPIRAPLTLPIWVRLLGVVVEPCANFLEPWLRIAQFKTVLRFAISLPDGIVVLTLRVFSQLKAFKEGKIIKLHPRNRYLLCT